MAVMLLASMSIPVFRFTVVDFHSLPALPVLDVKSILKSSHLPMLAVDLICNLGRTGLLPIARNTLELLLTMVDKHGWFPGEQRARIGACGDNAIHIFGSKYLTS